MSLADSLSASLNDVDHGLQLTEPGTDIRSLEFCPEYISQFDLASKASVTTSYSWQRAKELVEDLREWVRPHNFSLLKEIRADYKTVSERTWLKASVLLPLRGYAMLMFRRVQIRVQCHNAKVSHGKKPTAADARPRQRVRLFLY